MIDLPPELDGFVDRVSELERFREIVTFQDAARRERVLIYYGPPGIGKTLLLDRIAHECSLLGYPVARINFEGGRYNSYLRILRTIRDALDATCFSEFTLKVNQYFSPPQPAQVTINVSGQGTSPGINIQNTQSVNISGDLVAGDKIVVRDNFFIIPRPDADIEFIQDTISHTFLENLQQFAQKRKAVILLDGLDHEYCDPITRNWVLNEFVAAVCKFSDPGITPVLTMSNRIALERAIEVRTSYSQLTPFTVGDIIEFLKWMKLPEFMIQGAAWVIASQTEGTPARMVEAVTKLVEMMEMKGG